MRAMVLEQPGRPLRLTELPQPVAHVGQLLLAVEACGVCRTDLHLLDGELPDPVLPVVPGHEIVARVAGLGPDVHSLVTARCAWPAIHAGSASTALVRRHTSSPSWRARRAAKSLPSHAPVMAPARYLPAAWARTGRPEPTRPRRSRWTRP